MKDDGDKLEPERLLLQLRLPEMLKETVEILERNYDVIATRDYANTDAKADVVLSDGTVLVKDAPTPFLLWLEKRVDDLHTFVCKLPTLPADIEWEWDENQNCYRNAQEIKTVRTNKIAYPLVLAEATKEHPAQVVEKARDEIVGHWTTIKYCGALRVQDVKKMKERVEALRKAVKFAREKANEIETDDKKLGAGILSYVFGEFAS